MKRIKPSDKTKRFGASFVSGMAAPLLLFGKFQPPALLHVQYVKPKSMSVKSALAKDWNLVGASVKKAAAEYGKKS
ncbi:hypothetical protein [Flavobacterium sp.]|uniref:hypothetical protein n=1 Tax=Flavobacterium sp. TaxID=239 RepID=UPI0037BF5D35